MVNYSSTNRDSPQGFSSPPGCTERDYIIPLEKESESCLLWHQNLLLIMLEEMNSIIDNKDDVRCRHPIVNLFFFSFCTLWLRNDLNCGPNDYNNTWNYIPVRFDS